MDTYLWQHWNILGRRLAHACVAMALLLGSPWLAAQSVVFINPGKSDEAYWRSAAAVMAKAADSLGMQLQVIYTERDRLKPIEVAQHIALQPASQRPDYLIISNEYSIAPSILKATEGSGIQVFMAFSGIHSDLHAQVGVPRQRFPLWLGSLEPNAEEAGYLTAQALIEAARSQPQLRDAQGKLQMVAIAGDRSTPTSVARNRGLRQAVQDAGGAVLLRQMVYGEWREDKAQEQAGVLFRRYPQARLFWAGNDLMAFGAMQAWRAHGGVPGQDALFSGVNNSTRAFDALRSGELSALAGGHFMAGAWAMVMLYDHYHGIDFASEGLELHYSMFRLFDVASSRRFAQRFGGEGQPLDFRPFSKHLNPQLSRYRFALEALL